jgi:hypothetical protein
MYAPKDDRKHRAAWRELYDDAECGSLACFTWRARLMRSASLRGARYAETLRSVVRAATDAHVSVYYALSPGLDFDYASADDLHKLLAKLGQVQHSRVLWCCGAPLMSACRSVPWVAAGLLFCLTTLRAWMTGP